MICSKHFFLYLGTGKTATFSIAILQTIDTDVRGCQALVLAPSKFDITLKIYFFLT